MDEKCLPKLQEDKTEVMKSKEKPKKMEAPTPKVTQVQSSPRVPLCGRGYNALGVSRVPQPPRSPPLGQREPPLGQREPPLNLYTNFTIH